MIDYLCLGVYNVLTNGSRKYTCISLSLYPPPAIYIGIYIYICSVWAPLSLLRTSRSPGPGTQGRRNTSEQACRWKCRCPHGWTVDLLLTAPLGAPCGSQQAEEPGQGRDKASLLTFAPKEASSPIRPPGAAAG